MHDTPHAANRTLANVESARRRPASAAAPGGARGRHVADFDHAAGDRRALGGFYVPARHNASTIEKLVTLLGPARLTVRGDGTVHFKGKDWTPQGDGLYRQAEGTDHLVFLIGTGGQRYVATDGLLAELFQAAGLRIVRFDTWLGATQLGSIDTFLAGELLPTADEVDQTVRDRISEDCHTALARFVDPAGAIAAPIEVHLITAQQRSGSAGRIESAEP